MRFIKPPWLTHGGRTLTTGFCIEPLLTTMSDHRREEGLRGLQLPCIARRQTTLHSGSRYAQADAPDPTPSDHSALRARTDGHLRVWSTEAIYNASDPGYAGPKQLAAMSHHSGVIHTVRFSPNNRLLASGADDRIVCVYVLDPNPPTHQAGFGTSVGEE